MTINKTTAWMLAARPRTLPAALAPILLSQSLALSHEHFSITLALLILVCALSLQIAVNIANDLFDFQNGIDDPDRLGPPRAAQSGWLTVSELKSGLLLALLVSLISGIGLIACGGWIFAVLGVLSIGAALAYSAGPLPLASNALGEITVFLFFGLLAVLGSYYLQTTELSWSAWIAAIQMGSLTAAIMLVNNLRDIPTDSRAGKRTLAVKLGTDNSRHLYYALLLLPFGLLLLDSSTHTSLAWMALLPTIVMIRILSDRHGRVLNRQLAQTALLCLVFSVLRSLDIWISLL